ncbi:MAG: diaminopimelate epimerase [Muribaculaceae bacterium]|nr:diaminopimelate epimerase [Muribaculaceae bacterium]
MSAIPFVKMHGTGNDFVVLDFFGDAAAVDVSMLPELARRMCRRRFSVGADGLIAVLPEAGFDARMRIFNADGSEAQMCGNGIRCVARLLHERGRLHGNVARIATAAGLRYVQVTVDADGVFATATVDMGAPEFEARMIPANASGTVVNAEVSAGGDVYTLTAVSMGNPHGVVFVDDVEDYPVAASGSALENCPLWVEKANIEFAEIRPGSIRMRTWERGVGETLACGTGACAVAAAAIAGRRGVAPFVMDLDGGRLCIDVGADGHLLLTGAAEHVFDGVFEL